MITRIAIYSCGLWLLLAALIPLAAATSKPPENCIPCHAENALKKNGFSYTVHKPFRENKCTPCHWRSPVDKSSEAKSDTSGMIASSQVNWLHEIFTPAEKLLVPIPQQYQRHHLVIHAWDQCRDKHQKQIAIPPWGNTPPQPPQHRQLAFNNVRITAAPGRQDSVLVSWHSPVPVKAWLTYRHPQYNHTHEARTEAGYRYHSRVQLTNLNPQSRYQLTITAEDIYGQQQNQQHSFVPARLPQAPKPEPSPPQNCRLRLETRIQQGRGQLQGQYLLQITCAPAAALSVGVTSEAPAAEGQGQSAAGMHNWLAEPYYTNYQACRSCHADQFGPWTHPTDIPIPKDMRLQPELPLLPNGRISCITCHERHTGDDSYRLRASSKKELCRSCHQKY